MGTHDETNKAEPQNEFLTGFKIKSKEEQSFFNKGKISGDFGSQKMRTGLQNTSGANPYQLTQQSGKNAHSEQPGIEFLEKSSGPGFVQKLKSKLFHGESDSGKARQKVMVVMIPILFVIMVFMFRQVLSKSPQKSEGAPGEEKVITAANKSSGNEIEWKIPDPLPLKVKDSPTAGNQNPINKNVQENTSNNESIEEMDVKSILFSDDKPSVVIGNQLVYLNQEINGITVREIHQDYIIMEKDGSRWKQKVSDDGFQEKQELNSQQEKIQNGQMPES